MSEISVTVNGSTTINPTVGNGDTVNVTISATGERGPTGSTGASGPATKIAIGTVVTGADAAATMTGTAPSQTLSLVLPQGATGGQGVQGIQGVVGPPISLSLGTITVGNTASATLSGTTPNQILSMTFPVGPTGATGAVGPATTVQVGTVTTSAPGTSAKIDTLTSGSVATLNFTIPRGVDGTANLGDETPQPLGVASAGSAGFASRADHRHAVPIISYANLSGVPATFAPATHSHAIADVTNLQAVLDGKQVAGTYATLVGGTVPSSQLPSFVDDVIEYANLAGFPATGDVGKLFVARDTNKVYRWSGTTYIEIASSPGSTDVVVEGTTNLYFTTKRASDAAPVQSVNGKTGVVTIEAGGIAWSTAPTATTTTTTAGQLSYDENFLYVANAVNQWRRVGIEDWTTPTITISVQPADTSAIGATATFSVTATASQNAELLYQWQRQAGGTGSYVNIATGLSATLLLADLSYAANNGDKYRVVILSGAAGTGGSEVAGWLPAVVVELTPTVTVTSGVATLTISAAISIVTQPQNVTLTTDTSASFSISATTPGTGLAYQWQSSPDGTNWTAISGATAATYALSSVNETGYTGTRYRCVVSSSGYDNATSNAALLTVAPITVTAQPANKTGTPVAGTTPNYSASFAAAATSPAGPPTLQWQISTDGGTTFSDVSGQTASSLALTGLTSADSGKRFRARFARSGWADVSSNDATLTVPTDVITVTQQPSNTTASVSAYSATAFTLPTGIWNDISYANGRWYAVPNDTLGGDYIATSDNGVTWTLRLAALPYAGRWTPVVYGNGVYVTVKYGSTQAASSTDGIAWTARTLPSTITPIAVVHNGTTFFAMSSQGQYHAKSSNGVTWTATITVAGEWRAVTVDGASVYVVQVAWAGDSGPAYGRVYRSTDQGISWSKVFNELPSRDNANFPHYLAAVIASGTTVIALFSGERVPAATGSYTQLAVSSDGGNFVDAFTPFVFLAICRGATRYAAVTTAGIASSSDGSNWVLRQSLTNCVEGKIVATSNGFVAAVRQASNASSLHTSSDALAWTSRASVTSSTTLASLALAVDGNRALAATSTSGSIHDVGGLISAAFASTASTTFGAPATQWQQSSDGGATFTDIAGAVSSPLSFTPVSGDTGKRYRAVYTKSQYTTVNSNAAILTVY